MNWAHSYCEKKTKAIKIISGILFLLSTGFGLRVAVGGSLDYRQIFLFVIPSTVGGFIIAQLSSLPIFGVLIPLAILSGRAIYQTLMKNVDIFAKLLQNTTTNNWCWRWKILIHFLKMQRLPYNFLLMKYLYYLRNSHFHCSNVTS